MKVEEGVCIALEAVWRAKEEDHTRIEAKEEAYLVEEKRLKYEEEEEDLWMKAEEKARTADVARLKVEEHESALLKVEEGSASPFNKDRYRIRRSSSTHGLRLKRKHVLLKKQG